LLINYDWPGNIRELENVLEYAFVKTPSGEVIVESKLPPKIISPIKKKPAGTEKGTFYNEERLRLIHILEENRWNQTKSAEVLGIGRTTLWRKLKKYGLID
ncbi:MAG: helix-turn-helix domain-containing protein, partial [Melioribacteraceae bacterium]|nr:helix-turn-helix domain-containing protein [Melioribacteraceae bacterium]